MEARENPLHQHWGTRFKSIDEVSKEMIECKEEVDRAWKLKREEKNWWREGSNEKEVGWWRTFVTWTVLALQVAGPGKKSAGA